MRAGEKMSGAAAGPTTQQIYKVALASIVGSVIEQYDFLVPARAIGLNDIGHVTLLAL